MSDGGLAVCIAEKVLQSGPGIGAKIDMTSNLSDTEMLFGECGSVIIVSLNKSNLFELVLLTKKYDITLYRFKSIVKS